VPAYSVPSVRSAAFPVIYPHPGRNIGIYGDFAGDARNCLL